MSEAPFKVGQRVRMKAGCAGATKFRTGVVVRCRRSTYSNSWWISIRRDGASPKARYQSWAKLWELVPAGDLTLDQTAQALADAVKLGDTNAALLLADRVFELVGGTPKEAHRDRT